MNIYQNKKQNKNTLAIVVVFLILGLLFEIYSLRVQPILLGYHWAVVTSVAFLIDLLMRVFKKPSPEIDVVKLNAEIDAKDELVKVEVHQKFKNSFEDEFKKAQELAKKNKRLEDQATF